MHTYMVTLLRRGPTSKVMLRVSYPRKYYNTTEMEVVDEGIA